ncbi:Fibronectin type III domain protein [Kribbella flavida DSM 17836]|uniref:Fibronectin type III domain protein n=1 Tax=Kribbella flavida (strain DSM 17836 / JCM 10339 / NBRC 14399) TaxID=479435 RepID=D2PYM2_KRIFD|nr:fibronectin type III domain-containing protein [Kribbella flavida]ADB29868.1 Fibronectin type III domain protein [Kribbella flavida DSM 17836]
MKPFTQMRRRLTERETGEPTRRSEVWRPRAALAAVVAGCVAVTGVAVAGAGSAAPGVEFSQSGRYVYNATLGKIFHVNGSTKNVDQQIPLPDAGPGTQVVESDENGYVLAEGRTFEFGKSTLEVADPQPAPANELPVGLEGGGAAFAIYRQAGRIVRFDDHPAVAAVGVPLGAPVVTSDGTVWVHRSDNGQLCLLPLDADRLACPAKVPAGHGGALSVLGEDQVVFVDTTAREVAAVDEGGLGRQVPLPVADLPSSAIVAANDVGGRLAIVDPQRNVLHLVGTSELTTGKPDPEPVRKPLRKGRYERIASTGASLALIDDSTDSLVTLDRNGTETSFRRIPPPTKQAKVDPKAKTGLYRGGDARLYVAGRSGEQVMVVDDTGDVTAVDTNAADRPAKPGGDPTPGDRPSSKPTQRPSTPPVKPSPPPVKPSPPPVKPSPPTTTTQRPDPPEQTNRPPQDRPTNRPQDRPGGDATTERPSGKPKRPTTPPVKPAVQASRPGAPRAVSGSAGESSVRVNWEAAAANGAAVTQYVVSWAGGSRTLSASARSFTVTGLTNGTGYTVTVRAVNRVGTGPASSTSRLVPTGGAADAPGNLQLTGGDARIAVSWSRPDLQGNRLLGYQVETAVTSTRVTSTRHTITGLKNGTTYRVSVRAVTTDSSGRQIYGRAVAKSIKLGSGVIEPRLTASRGASTSHGSGDDACEPPGCAYIRIVGTGLKPNTEYEFVPYTTKWQPSNGGADLRTEADGSILIDDRFATDASGQQVWVVATGPDGEKITSNKFNWGSR